MKKEDNTIAASQKIIENPFIFLRTAAQTLDFSCFKIALNTLGFVEILMVIISNPTQIPQNLLFNFYSVIIFS